MCRATVHRVAGRTTQRGIMGVVLASHTDNKNKRVERNGAVERFLSAVTIPGVDWESVHASEGCARWA